MEKKTSSLRNRSKKFNSSKVFVKKSRIPRQVFLAWLLVFIAGFAGTLLFAEAGIRDKTAEWQRRMVSESAGSASLLEAWVKSSLSSLDGIAGNQSVQIYLEVQNTGNESPEKEVQAMFLRNLLESVSRQSGFNTESSSQPAQVGAFKPAGIIIIDGLSRFVASSTGTTAYAGEIEDAVKKLPRKTKTVLMPLGNSSSGYYMLFYTPIMQGNKNFIGAIIGLRTLSGFFPEALGSQGTQSSATIGMLVKKSAADEASLQMSASSDGRRIQIADLKLTGGEAKPVELLALESPGQAFVAADVEGKMVIAAASQVNSLTGWYMMRKVDESAALGGVYDYRNALLSFYVLAFLVVSLATVALWKHIRSIRIADAADHYKNLMHKYRQQGSLLSLISNNQPGSTFILDEKLRVRFANHAIADRARMLPEEMIGKTLSSAMGTGIAQPYEEKAWQALKTGRQVSATFRFEIDDIQQVVSVSFVPLRDVPDEHEGGLEKGVLVVEEDITAAIIERELKEKTLRRLVGTLVAVMDSRDPFAAHHSARVAKLARKLAENIGLIPEMMEAAEVAGRLMNIGKIMIPETLLSSSGTLKIKDLSDVRTAISSSAKLLEGMEFTGPVVETIRQSQERPDGSGLIGLTDEEILPTARVVSVANAFIAMVSNRSYRQGMGVEEAMAEIQEGAGETYDRHVVAALVHFIENQGGREEFAEFEEFLQASS